MTDPPSDEQQGNNQIPEPPRLPPVTLQPSTKKKHGTKPKVFRVFRSVVRSFPIFSPTCSFNGTIPRMNGTDGHIHGARRMTGTLFGHRKARITVAIQENPRGVPILLLELGIPTAKFMQDMGSGLLRIALECEKKPDKTKLLDEPIWTAFANGKKIGYGTKREPTETDLKIMQVLHAVSMGAGVLPADMTDPVDGELTYMGPTLTELSTVKILKHFTCLILMETVGLNLAYFLFEYDSKVNICNNMLKDKKSKRRPTVRPSLRRAVYFIGSSTPFTAFVSFKHTLLLLCTLFYILQLANDTKGTSDFKEKC